MNIIYADTLFALSVFTDYLLLVVTARFCSLRLRRRRYLAAAVLGGVYAVAVFLPGCAWMAHPLVELCAAGFMGLLAFGGEEKLFRCCAAFLAVSASFGGAAWAVCMRSGGTDIRLLAAVFLGSYALLTLLSYTRRRRAREHRVGVTLTLGPRRAAFTALEDSGNCLTDPITCDRVLLASPAALRPLFPGQEALLELGAVELVQNAAPCRFRLLRCGSIGGPALLAAFRPDAVTVDGEKRPLLVAVSENARGDGFEGIF
jgi:stage II sporulation protein GA (sporulation sigma-E factor processing peptidase)